jgi:hypothetical protein
MLARFRSLLSKVHPALWLLVGFVLMCCAYEYGRVLWLRPFPHHLSRQTTCLSITYNIYKGEAGLFAPAVHNYFADHHTSGKSAGEFPLLYWSIAQIWKLTGPSEFVYRLFMLLLHFGGTCAMFLGLRKLLAHSGWAALIALLFFASPVMAYFSIGFLPDVPSFDLALIGCWVLLRRSPAQRKGDIVLSSVLFTVAGLLKITALMAPLTFLAWLLLEWALPRWASRNHRVFPHRWTLLLSLVICFALVWKWYSYSVAYNNEHGAEYSYQGTWAVWDLPPAEVRASWEFGKNILVFQIFDTPVWLAFGLMACYLLWSVRHASRPLGIITLMLMAGTVLYILLWWVTLDSHDYYYINPLITLVAFVALFFEALRRRHPRIFRSPWAMAAFFGLVGYSVLYTANNHQMRTRGNTPMRAEYVLPLYHEGEIFYWDMSQYWDMKDMLDLEPYNRSLGIKEDDMVISLEDRTVCAALYLMHQRGWVQFGQTFANSSEIRDLIDHGASYLFAVSPEWLDKPYMQEFYRYPLGQHGAVRVYDLRPFHTPEWKAPHPWGRPVVCP